MGYRITLSVGKSDRIKLGDTIEELFKESKYGFYWWFWKPRLNYNGGKFKYRECIDIGINWLCFWIGVTFWPLSKSNRIIFGFSASDNSPKHSSINGTNGNGKKA